MIDVPVRLSDSLDPARAVSLAVTRAIAEIATLTGGLLVLMWVMPIVDTPYWIRHVTAVALFGFLIACHRAEQADLRDLGVRRDNFGVAVRELALPTVVLAFVLIGFGWVEGSLKEPVKFLKGPFRVLPWGFLQQLMLLGFCHRRMRIVLGQGYKSVAATALLFGLLHAPNPPLMVVCMLAGALWARQFDRNPNLFATALSHSVLSTSLSSSLPKSILHCTRVGYRYLLH